MRLDKFIQLSRIIKRRTVAKKVCDSSHVSVNNQQAKAGKELKAGDVLEINLGARGVLTCEVLEIPKGGVRKEQAASLYRIISQTHPDEDEEEW